MKQQTKKWALIAVLCAAGLLACQKNPGEQTCITTTAGIAGTYKLSAVEYKRNAASAPIDYLPFMDACEKDDLLQLKNDGTYTYTDAGLTCSPNGSDNGSWSVTGNKITSDGIIGGTIQSYDCKTLVAYIENVTVPGDRITQTLVKQ